MKRPVDSLNGGYVFFGFVVPMVIFSLFPWAQKYLAQMNSLIISTIFAHSVAVSVVTSIIVALANWEFSCSDYRGTFSFIIARSFLKKTYLKLMWSDIMYFFLRNIQIFN